MKALLYTNYKEPLRPNTSGYGYLGTVAHTKDGEFIQCYECGELVVSLTVHVKKHQMKPREYREKYQLNARTPLCSKNFSNNKRAIYQQVVSPGLQSKRKEAHKKYWEDVKSGKRERAGVQTSRSLEWHNSKGTCPDQILDKLKQMGDVSYDELRKNHSKLLNRLIRVYGSLNKARKMAGLTIRSQSSGHPPIQHTRASLLEALRDFYEANRRTPLTSDFKVENNLPSFATYQRQFGTINGARMEAGIPLLIPIGNRQFVEVMPDEASQEQLEKVLA